MKKILSVFGTRPEAIKMAPLVKEIEKNHQFESIVCVTGQHREMLQQVLTSFDILPNVDLNIMRHKQTLVDITANVLIELTEYLEREKVDMILVHGDTSTTFSAALAAFYQQIPVGHVEAGLRTYDKYSPFPEEMNRQLTTRLATLHFAPTESNVRNLHSEGITENIYLTGNTVIDALKYTVQDNYVFQQEILNQIDFSKKTILVTAHRRENLGDPMHNIAKALLEIVKRNPDIQIVFPVHLNPKVREIFFTYCANNPQIFLIDPVEVFDMHNLINKSYLVLTDSGGLQEEAPSLGKPVLVLREETERPEAVEKGTVKVIGTNEETIISEVQLLFDSPELYGKMAHAENPYGDGNASKYIVQAIEQYLKK